MKNVIIFALLAIALIGQGCAKAKLTDATATENAFPTDLKFSQPAGVK